MRVPEARMEGIQVKAAEKPNEAAMWLSQRLQQMLPFLVHKGNPYPEEDAQRHQENLRKWEGRPPAPMIGRNPALEEALLARIRGNGNGRL